MLIIDLALFGIAQDIVGFLNFLEAVFSSLVAWIQVRMVLAGQLPIGLADLVRLGIAGDTEELVIILFRSRRNI